MSPKENYDADVENDNELIINYISKFKNHNYKIIKHQNYKS